MSLGPKVSAPLQTILTFGRFINRKIIYVRYNVLLDGNVINLFFVAAMEEIHGSSPSVTDLGHCRA